MSTLRAIHAAKARIGLDDDAYRDLLERETGKRSSKGMTESERRKVLATLNARGGARRKLDGKYAPKLQALWIAAWNLGIIRNRDDAALVAFVKRQAGIDHTRWLNSDEDAIKVIEALKSWLARETRIDWSTPISWHGYELDDNRARIVTAQWLRLIELGAVTPFCKGSEWSDLWGNYGYTVTGLNHPRHYTSEQWIKVMNALGEKLHAAMAKVEK